MAIKCMLCGKEYKYCKNCKSDYRKELWRSLYDTENCKNISKALSDYNFNRITKDEAKDILSKCDLSIDFNSYYRNEVNEIMAKPKRGTKAKMLVLDEIVPEEVKEEVQEELDGVVVTE